MGLPESILKGDVCATAQVRWQYLNFVLVSQGLVTEMEYTQMDNVLSVPQLLPSTIRLAMAQGLSYGGAQTNVFLSASF